MSEMLIINLSHNYKYNKTNKYLPMYMYFIKILYSVYIQIINVIYFEYSDSVVTLECSAFTVVK